MSILRRKITLGIGLLILSGAVLPVNAFALEKPVYNTQDCNRTRVFYENAFAFSKNVVDAGRCVKENIPKVKAIGSYNGHFPTASKALDVMANLKGSCKSGRSTGNSVAKYFMFNAKEHRVLYLIWKNSYWSADSKPKKFSGWRHGTSGGSCTTRHFDHVHVAFKK